MTAIMISSDGTSHHHVDFTSHHVALRTTHNGPDAHIVCLLGVDSSINHTADMQVEGWKEKVQTV
ncbi:hypothetical protein PAXRUDRAFT_171042 [Paxillus rubicundulus Ve08.2h10]|uniref:Uncharacterized protein n=1 Tax=Paxillus rubicundulus Ve08.2h10 TaxID=930991 RepID=A0A0D0DEP5_9AGAM|nr:hypothetical protein PAXRUDRAFT_171042 [Paxillus rubicundulus Ve08.2h10]